VALDRILSDKEFVSFASDQDLTVEFGAASISKEYIESQNLNYKGKRGGNPLYKNSPYTHIRTRVLAKDCTRAKVEKPAVSSNFEGIYPVSLWDQVPGVRRTSYCLYKPKYDYNIGYIDNKRQWDYQADLNQSFELLFKVQTCTVEDFKLELAAKIDPFDFWHF
jgi:hypothetical protein